MDYLIVILDKLTPFLNLINTVVLIFILMNLLKKSKK